MKFWDTSALVPLLAEEPGSAASGAALRAADAFHVAAALLAASDRPGEFAFVTLDERQGKAAEREGFRVLPLPSV